MLKKLMDERVQKVLLLVKMTEGKLKNEETIYYQKKWHLYLQG